MAVGFTLETIALGALVIVPLLFTGVIPIAARPRLAEPVTSINVATEKPHAGSGGAKATFGARSSVVRLVSTNPNAIHYPTDPAVPEPAVNPTGFGPGPAIPDSLVRDDKTDCGCISRDTHSPIKVSVLSPAQLLKRVDPVYPHFAAASGISGEVKLHAIISKEGTIESLSVISGHPVLAGAALEAVKQWVYRPYILNGEKVEVETFIFVNFKKTGQ